MSKNTFSNDNSQLLNRKILISLISALIGFTILYQLRPVFDDSQFSLVSFFGFTLTPAILVGIASFITVKLHKQNHYQAKAFLFFTIGATCWFIAEQVWQAYDYFWEGSPFPSEADFFYLAAYPFMVAFLLYSLKPIIKTINRNVWLFAIGLSVSFLIPSITSAYDDMQGEEIYATSIALAYPILSTFQLIPAIVGIMFLSRREANISWMLILFGFIIYILADTFFLFAELDGSYYDGHPSDTMFIYSYVLFIFAIYCRNKIRKISSPESDVMFFSEQVKFETINKFGIPLTISIVCMVILISLFNTVILSPSESLTVQNLMLGVVAMLAVFGVIVITINKNLSRLVNMRTEELIEQRDNLENLVEEKTHELLKTERLSAIGELSGRLAHDLRNPLSVIKMSVDLIKQNPADSTLSDPVVMKRIDLIEKSIDRISHQVDDVLGYVRNSPLKLTSVSLTDIIDDSLSKINIPKDIEIKFSKKNIQLDCDPVKMDAVFINLIVNAIQALPDGGTIDIKIEEKSDKIIMKFCDSGPGISKEHIDKVFEPLFTTKQKGTGLGLASCKNIIEQHLGEISVHNNPTTFTITLPKTLTTKKPEIQS